MVLNVYRHLKKLENQRLYYDYALASLSNTFENMKRNKLSEALREIKRHKRDAAFLNDSKKIFYKIGLATFMVLTQKIKYRLKERAFRKAAYKPKSIKDRNLKSSYISEERS